jgi:hypothetical protein
MPRAALRRLLFVVLALLAAAAPSAAQRVVAEAAPAELGVPADVIVMPIESDGDPATGEWLLEHPATGQWAVVAVGERACVGEWFQPRPTLGDSPFPLPAVVRVHTLAGRHVLIVQTFGVLAPAKPLRVVSLDRPTCPE